MELILIVSFNPCHRPGKLLLIPSLGHQVQRCVNRIQNLKSTPRRVIRLIHIISLPVKDTKTRFFREFRIICLPSLALRTPSEIRIEIPIVRGNPIEFPSETFFILQELLKRRVGNRLETDVALRQMIPQSVITVCPKRARLTCFVRFWVKHEVNDKKLRLVLEEIRKGLFSMGSVEEE